LWTLELDGQATGCNPVEVGSIPTGVSGWPRKNRPTAGSEHMLLEPGVDPIRLPRADFSGRRTAAG
jgi:hypothetical protein